jgi:hypothetical protein
MKCNLFECVGVPGGANYLHVRIQAKQKDANAASIIVTVAMPRAASEEEV